MSQKLEGRVEAVLIFHRDEENPSEALGEAALDWEGIRGDKHYGLTAKAGSSQKPYPKGTEVRNTRQISIVSVEEMEQVAASMQIPSIQPGWVGANLLFSGIPQLSKLPIGTRLHFSDGTGLVIEEENTPCTTAGAWIQREYPDIEGLTQGFPKHALGKRGLMAWVERPGSIRVGETVSVRLPKGGQTSQD